MKKTLEVTPVKMQKQDLLE